MGVLTPTNPLQYATVLAVPGTPSVKLRQQGLVITVITLAKKVVFLPHCVGLSVICIG